MKFSLENAARSDKPTQNLYLSLILQIESLEKDASHPFMTAIRDVINIFQQPRHLEMFDALDVIIERMRSQIDSQNFQEFIDLVNAYVHAKLFQLQTDSERKVNVFYQQFARIYAAFPETQSAQFLLRQLKQSRNECLILAWNSLIRRVVLLLKNQQLTVSENTWYGRKVTLHPEYVELRAWVDEQCATTWDPAEYHHIATIWLGKDKCNPAFEEISYLSRFFNILTSPLMLAVGVILLLPVVAAMNSTESSGNALKEIKDSPCNDDASYQGHCDNIVIPAQTTSNHILPEPQSELMQKAMDILNRNKLLKNDASPSVPICYPHPECNQLILKHDPGIINASPESLEDRLQRIMLDRRFYKYYFNVDIGDTRHVCTSVENDIYFKANSPTEKRIELSNWRMWLKPDIDFETNIPALHLIIRTEYSVLEFAPTNWRRTGDIEVDPKTLLFKFPVEKQKGEIFHVFGTPEQLRQWLATGTIFYFVGYEPRKVSFEFKIFNPQKSWTFTQYTQRVPALVTQLFAPTFQREDSFKVALSEELIYPEDTNIKIDSTIPWLQFSTTPPSFHGTLTSDTKEGLYCARLSSRRGNSEIFIEQCFDVKRSIPKISRAMKVAASIPESIVNSGRYTLAAISNLPPYPFLILLITAGLIWAHDKTVSKRLLQFLLNVPIPAGVANNIARPMLANRYYSFFGYISPVSRYGIRRSTPFLEVKAIEQVFAENYNVVSFQLIPIIHHYLTDNALDLIVALLAEDHRNRAMKLIRSALHDFINDPDFSLDKCIAAHLKNGIYRVRQSVEEILQASTQEHNFHDETQDAAFQAELRYRLYSLLLLDLPAYGNMRAFFEVSGQPEELCRQVNSLEELQSLHQQIKTDHVQLPPHLQNSSLLESVNEMINMRSRACFTRLQPRFNIDFSSYLQSFDLYLRECEYLFALQEAEAAVFREEWLQRSQSL